MLLAGKLCAQAVPSRIAQDAAFLKDPGGVRLGLLNQGAAVVPGRVSGAFTEITLQGWMLSASLRPDAREGFDVSARSGESIRTEPNGPAIGRVVIGALLSRLATRGGWTEVRRSGWIATDRLAAAPATRSAGAPAPGDDRPSARQPDRPASDSSRVFLRKGAVLQSAPDGNPLATLGAPADASVTQRNGEWVRVRVEAWVKAGDVAGALAPPPAITAAMLREHPERYVGQSVAWRVQFLAHQKADELRPEMPPGAPYLLARGPLPETGFVYVLLSRQQAADLVGLKALEELALMVTVRSARTRYLATPVVELERVIGGAAR